MSRINGKKTHTTTLKGFLVQPAWCRRAGLSCVSHDPFRARQVVYREGIVVRSSAKIEDGRIIRIAPFGSILHATGKVQKKKEREGGEGEGLRFAFCDLEEFGGVSILAEVN